MLVIDYRFFLRNKLFFLCQLSILVVPFFLNSCVYKVSHTFENLSNISGNLNGNSDGNGKKKFKSKTEKLEIDKKFLDITNNDKLNISAQIVQVTNTISNIEENLKKLLISGLDNAENEKNYKEL